MILKQEITVEQLSQIVKGKVLGPKDNIVKGINEIHKVMEGDLTFVDHPKYYDKALNSKATFILINKELEAPTGKTLIVHEDPFKAYNLLVDHFYKFEPAVSAISPSAQIGEGTVVQPHTFVGNHVKIGKNCLIHPNVTIYDHVQIGDNVVIHSNTSIGSDAFYFQKRDNGYNKMTSCGNVIIHDCVEIGSGCTIDKGVSGNTVIGSGTKLDNQIHIAHGAVIGKNCLFAAQTTIAGKTIVEDDVILWGQVGVNKSLTIGKGAVVMAQSGVTHSIEGGKTYFGMPVQEYREQLRQQASLRKLPALLKKLKF